MMTYGCRIAIVALMSICGALQMAGAEDYDGVDSIPSATIQTETIETENRLHFSGFWTMETGQMLDFWMLNSNIGHQNVLRTHLNFGVSKLLTERLQIQASAEAEMYFNTFDKKYNFGVESFVLPEKYYRIFIHCADAVYSFGDIESPFLQLTLGYFPFKYNPDVRDLGEYLYRSGTYPAYLVNDFDFPLARLAGLKVSNDLGEWFHQDLLVTTEVDKPPFFDMNIGYIATVDIKKFLNIGLGGMYHSVWPANKHLTAPEDPANLYLENAELQTDGTYLGDTTYYTYAGLKLMGRFTFDAKRIFVSDEADLRFLGVNDLKFYGELTILGVKNYPATKSNSNNPYGYDTLGHKTPIMLGFNLPTFRALDVFAMELEWYGCKYPNNFEFKGQSQILPVPCPETQGLTSRNYAKSDNWKWAIYTKKSFNCGVFLVGQFANDHIRNETPIASSVDQEEALRTNHAWWWAFKMGYQF